MIRKGGEWANEGRLREGAEPVFEMTEDGDVLCARGGRPVTSYRQMLAEPWYWEQVAWGEMGLIHDEGREAFYSPEGELALSRDRVNLPALFVRRG
jgi:hypothetical protein